jgi:AcrR family transcriptional regulator
VRTILDEGVAAASAKHIAERAGVTWGVIQYHFGSRDGLFAAVVGTGFDALKQTMAQLELPVGPTRERLQALVDAAWSAFSSPTSRASLEILVATRPGRDPALGEPLEAMARELRRLGRSLAGRGRPEVGDLVWAVLRGLVLEQMVVTEPVDTDRQRSMLVDVLSVYFGADPPV